LRLTGGEEAIGSESSRRALSRDATIRVEKRVEEGSGSPFIIGWTRFVDIIDCAFIVLTVRIPSVCKRGPPAAPPWHSPDHSRLHHDDCKSLDNAATSSSTYNGTILTYSATVGCIDQLTATIGARASFSTSISSAD
jgi:hypothetical protein